MDALDHKIIGLLKEDGKKTIADLAKAVNRSTTPVHERVKRLERDGVIQGYTAVIDPEKIGLGLTAFCEVNLQSHEAEMLSTFEKNIAEMEEVIECHHIAGSFDYLLKVQTADIHTYQKFLSEKLATVKYIGKLQSAFAMKSVK